MLLYRKHYCYDMSFDGIVNVKSVGAATLKFLVKYPKVSLSIHRLIVSFTIDSHFGALCEFASNSVIEAAPFLFLLLLLLTLVVLAVVVIASACLLFPLLKLPLDASKFLTIDLAVFISHEYEFTYYTTLYVVYSI